MNDNTKQVLRVCNVSFFLLGMIVVCIGPLLPSMMDYYDIGYTQSGTLIFMLSMGSFFATTFGGVLSEKIGNKMLSVIGSAFFSICFFGLLVFKSVSIVYILWGIAGFGWGFYNIAVNDMVARYSNNDHRVITKLHTRFAIGAILAPIIIGTLVNANLSWKIFIAFVAVFALYIAILMMSVTVYKQQAGEKKTKNNYGFLKNPKVYLFMALLFFYVGSESAINGWMTTYLMENNIVTGVLASYFVSILWVLVLIGRLINMRLSSSISMEIRIMICSIAALMMFVLFLNTSAVWIIILSVVILGLAMSAIYPNAVTNAYQRISEETMAFGLILSFGGLGSAIVPWLNGLVADRVSLNAGMMVIIVSTLLLVLLTAVNYIDFNRAKHDTDTI